MAEDPKSDTEALRHAIAEGRERLRCSRRTLETLQRALERPATEAGRAGGERTAMMTGAPSPTNPHRTRR